MSDKSGHAIIETMKYTWRALEARFGDMDGERISIGDCRAHTEERKRAGISDGTIHTELGHLRMVLVWAEKHGLIDKAPYIERPQKPEPKDRYMTRDEAKRIINEARTPHLRLAFHLMLATAARVTALLELTWDRVDMDRRLIYLRDPNDPTRRKGRAIVPINATLLAALQEARGGALTDYVIEWAGQPVKSLKKGIATAADKAGLEGISAHVFRHTAAVWMVEAGVPMEEVSQYLGHKNVNITRKVYAKYSPTHLRRAAEALEMGIYEVPPGSFEPAKKNTK
ncbi:tyrosine-type recombinase/integrase [Falsochrobactrum shanghaiense]|nr:site-specific integrase [Falsochrobactrum shanghaiense]